MNTGIIGSFNLYSTGLPVGMILEAFESDGTWYGRFEPQPQSTPAADSYIKACVEWNEALKRGDDLVDMEKLYPYAFLPRQWWVAGAVDGHFVEDAPVFFSGGDVSWIPTPDPPPSAPRG